MASSSSSSSSSSPSSSTHQWKYDVFLSFRGEDTRKSFTDHLHMALRKKGVNTFMDDQLRRGEQISPALLKAIEESRFSIIVFSENYASSSWCLDELAKIVDSINVMGHVALPVFYNVDPSHVRKQTGSFAEAFKQHEQVYREKMEKVVKWREALTEAAKISGWDSRDRHESKLIEEIVRDISNKLVGSSSSYMKGLVGMGPRIEAMDSLLCIGSINVRMVGIWGMAGIGKTTIAKAVYERIYTQFEGCCFLSNVRENSQRQDLAYLQAELLSQTLNEGNPNIGIFNRGIDFIKDKLHSRKVLIVLDDIDHWQQLEALVGNHDWFGPGSRIIITTRKRHLLIHQEVDAIYKAEELETDEALKLFCQYAFRHKHPTRDFMQLCECAVDYSGGLPLALKVFGSFLYKKSIHEWKSEFNKLKQCPNREVQDVLKTSFYGLDDNEKDIFLDVAFFYKGHDKDFVGEILDSCDFFFQTGIRNLLDNSLITISDNKLCMHDLLQEMCWEIVRQESIKNPGKRIRLRVPEDINHVLTTNAGTEAVEGIVLDLSSSKELNFNVDAFKKMTKLRLLKVCHLQFCGSFEYLSWKELITKSYDAWIRRSYDMYNRKLHLCGDFKFLSNNLRSLYWHGYPLKSLPSNFHPEKLVELNMCFSRLEQLWGGNKPFEKLKSMELSHSQHLTKTPDFSRAPNLGSLILKGCTSLVKVHPSIGAHKKLSFLNLEGCKNLKNFSSSIHMESLQILTFSGCSNLKKFPEVQGNMEHLTELSLEGTVIKGLPLSIQYLTGLVLLNLRECKSLDSLPNSIFKLKSLKTLILSNCLRLKKLPEILENMGTLMELFLDGTAIRELPSLIGRPNGLVLLNLTNCKRLASLPESICKLTSLQTLNLSGCSQLKKLPDDLGSLQSLLKLYVDGTAIQEVPPSITLLPSLEVLSLSGCKGGESKSRNLVFAFLSSPTEYWLGLHSLKDLNLSDSNLLEGALPSDLRFLPSLESLDLSRNNFITMPASLSQLPRLKKLMLAYCKSLQSLPELPSSIEILYADHCTSLETFSYPSSAYKSKERGKFNFTFSNCFRLVENEHIDIMKAILLGIQHVASIPKALDPDNYYDAIVPGSSIPKWFIHQSMGSSVTVELPPHWHNTKLMGMAVCAVVDGDHSEFWSSGRFGKQNRTMKISFGRLLQGKKLDVKKCGVRLVYEKEQRDGECSFGNSNSIAFVFSYCPIKKYHWFSSLIKYLFPIKEAS
ncbi:disease resistance protein RPV1-like isoform X2 [Vitis riparia]|uniref:disease resistance protein RPV1-like isoform X2 n=1 Tax=Vitis riparia TaxID=96939 RepID=UPI00155A64D0|nr:disease resistance protein RPV1-like isoform X2 [Vitis riparia]